MAFFAKRWTVFKLVSSVALTTRFAVSATLAARSVWTAGLGTFLTVTLERLDRIYCRRLCYSTVQLVAVEIFYCHFMLFCILEQRLVCHILSSFL